MNCRQKIQSKATECLIARACRHPVIKEIVVADMKRWIPDCPRDAEIANLSRLFMSTPEFRSLFYYRVPASSGRLKWLYPPLRPSIYTLKTSDQACLFNMVLQRSLPQRRSVLIAGLINKSRSDIQMPIAAQPSEIMSLSVLVPLLSVGLRSETGFMSLRGLWWCVPFQTIAQLLAIPQESLADMASAWIKNSDQQS